MKNDLEKHIIAPPADGNWSEREILGYMTGVLDRFDTVCMHIEACCEALQEGLDGWNERLNQQGR